MTTLLQFIAVGVAGLIALALASKGKASWETADEAREVRRMFVGRAFAAALVFVGTLVVVFDFNIAIQ